MNYQTMDTLTNPSPDYPLDMRPDPLFKAVPRPVNHALANFKAWSNDTDPNGSSIPGRLYPVYTPPWSYPPPEGVIVR